MTVVNPLSTPNMVIQTPNSTAVTAAEREAGLRLEQMVRATVLEGGLDKALLEMNHRQYRAQSDIALQTGQKLTLQVLQLEPKLEFKILHDPSGNRLSQLLPLLSQPFDWAGLLGRLRQQTPSQNLSPKMEQVYQQLQQLLMPGARLPQAFEQSLEKLPAQLQQLYVAMAQGKSASEAGIAVTLPGQPFVYHKTEAVPVDVPHLIRALQGQLTQLQFSENRALPQAWLNETKTLLIPLQQSLSRGPVFLPQLNDLLMVLAQVRQQPALPPQFVAEMDLLIRQLTTQAGREQIISARPEATPQPAGPANQGLQSPVAQRGPAGQPAVAPPTAQHLPADVAKPPPQAPSPSAGGASYAGTYAPVNAASSPISQPVPVVPSEIGTGLQQLLNQVEQLQTQKGPLSPELLGRLEGLLDKLQQFPQQAQGSHPVLPGLEAIISQLSQLIQQGPQLPKGGSLGFLSQLFGFHLEAELLKGKTREALASLKMSLLTLQKDFAEEVKEPLQRLELFQLCKGKLSEEQVQFLPLPFNELEEGYLLMEDQVSDDEDGEEAKSMHLALSLRLSALGNMRVDMLYDKQGLHLRMSCEDKERMAYLQDHVGELEEAIESIPLRGVSFASDAEIPVQELMERLLPEALGILDARI